MFIKEVKNREKILKESAFMATTVLINRKGVTVAKHVEANGDASVEVRVDGKPPIYIGAKETENNKITAMMDD
ncbi:hypothetical protein EV210_12325 [Anaerospora hongkongensis]|uniref:Uncharacterized protein n=1 Tax=Anaerospora hongkongensis TaxID=244830 RepID=A0A4R1PLU7_9FIRM|nr:hypothetical protein [Anaerospora hongkongensis]TCL32205.1 hypothetical protein EV210_12325 [Anaerospora hongkongensis]